MTELPPTDPLALKQELIDLENKYERLVWYARSQPASCVDYWSKVPAQIRDGAFRSQMRVEEDYPDEVTQLRSEASDWQHGFNSGALAILRFILTAQYPILIEDEFEDNYSYGGIEDAREEFPCLDT